MCPATFFLLAFRMNKFGPSRRFAGPSYRVWYFVTSRLAAKAANIVIARLLVGFGGTDVGT